MVHVLLTAQCHWRSLRCREAIRPELRIQNQRTAAGEAAARFLRQEHRPGGAELSRPKVRQL